MLPWGEGCRPGWWENLPPPQVLVRASSSLAPTDLLKLFPTEGRAESLGGRLL